MDAQRTAGIETALAMPHPLNVEIELTGKVTPDEGRVGHVLPLSSGIVQTVLVHLGDRVQKGQPLLRYDNVDFSDLKGQYAVAKAELEKQQSHLEVTRRSVERSKPLLQAGAIPAKELDLRQGDFLQAQAAVTAQQAEVNRIEQKLLRFGMSPEEVSGPKDARDNSARLASIRAPFAGVITKFAVSPGEVISADKELFTVVDLSSVWVLADVFEKDLGALRSSGSCLVSTNSYPGKVFAGKVTDVSDFVDPETRTAKLRCVVANPNHQLKLDMFASVKIPSSTSRTALAIPSSALQELDGKQIAFVRVDETHFDTRELEIGTKTSEWVEVRKGVEHGEKVVVQGAFRLKSALKKESLKEEE